MGRLMDRRRCDGGIADDGDDHQPIGRTSRMDGDVARGVCRGDQLGVRVRRLQHPRNLSGPLAAELLSRDGLEGLAPLDARSEGGREQDRGVVGNALHQHAHR
jgi:hypothetical protein